jgi:hypothetical protein
VIVALVAVAGELAAIACPSQPCLAIAPATAETEPTVPMLAGREATERESGPALGVRLWLGHEDAEPEDSGEPELPEFWITLRKLRDCFPRIEGARDQQRFTAIFTPVIVTGPNDTVPGVGIGGDF